METILEKKDSDMPSDKKPFVAVYMISYNHEPFIEKAIESVMMQQTHFDVQLFIGDDCSKDATQAICSTMSDKYPGRIQLFLNKKNVGANQNAKQIFDATYNSGAQYIALLEGDDYWTDPLKLQKQVDFLEQHQECIFCFHNAFVEADNSKKNKESYPRNVEKEVLEAKDFFKIPTIPTASVMFRSIHFVPLNHSHGDFLLYCELLSKGKAGYINETMSAYRLHGGGVSAAYDSNAYLEKRIGEMQIEKKISFFSTAVKTEIDSIQTEHILHYLNKNRGQLKASQKRTYLSILLRNKKFYSQNRSAYFTLFRTLLK